MSYAYSYKTGENNAVIEGIKSRTKDLRNKNSRFAIVRAEKSDKNGVKYQDAVVFFTFIIPRNLSIISLAIIASSITFHKCQRPS